MLSGRMFFDGWEGLIRVLVVGACAYVSLVALLRVSGKRTLSKMNAFDSVVTIALGSTLATVILSKDVPLAEGLLALALLVLLQFVITWLSVRSSWVRRSVKAEPALLVRRGELLEDAMRRERVPRDEIESAIRQHGFTDLSAVDAVVLETDASFSVIGRPLKGNAEAVPDFTARRNSREAG